MGFILYHNIQMINTMATLDKFLSGNAQEIFFDSKAYKEILQQKLNNKNDTRDKIEEYKKKTLQMSLELLKARNRKINIDENSPQRFLNLDPEQFDQWLFGRRKFNSKSIGIYLSWDKQQTFEIFDKQAKIIDYYINNYPHVWPQKPSKQLLRFHEAQLLAFQEKTTEAIEIIKWMNRENIGITKTYYEATIAFLQHDKKTLKECQKEKADPNHEFIKRFFDNVDTTKTYLEIYNNI